ncbi:hypothetical protein [Mesorhizobium sp. WSM2239]|uniref:Uncharacterized protein n=2 Tax=unclassified Mesorhizobium TaxID=325217 RepID=A0AAU8DHB4_9HYPH
MLDSQKYTETLRRAVSSIEDTESDSREKSYDKIRKANERFLDKHRDLFAPEAVVQLTAALEEMIAAHRREAEPLADKAIPNSTHLSNGPLGDAGPEASAAWRRFLVGMFLGIGIGVVGTLSVFLLSEGETLALQLANKKNLPQVEIAVGFLDRIREEVTSRQRDDADGLSAVAGAKMIGLKSVMPELAREMPKTLPKSSAVVLRADATGYKILFNWPLCATVQYARPDLVDPVRARDVLGCSHFGIWNEAGAKW